MEVVVVKTLHTAVARNKAAIQIKNGTGLKRFAMVAVLGTTLLGTSACSQLWGSQTGKPNLKTSTVGAATGAAVGAGLGAIIGSTTGNAGEGLVIGTVAGSATGMAIGYQLEKQEDARAAQEETITRQNAELQFQNQQLKELKQNLGDQSGNNPLSGQRSSLTAQLPDTQPRISSFNRPSGNKGEASSFRGESASSHQLASAESRADERERLRSEIKTKLAGSPVTVGIAHSRPMPPPIPANEESIALDDRQDITPHHNLAPKAGSSSGAGFNGAGFNSASGTTNGMASAAAPGSTLLPPGKAGQHVAELSGASTFNATGASGGLPPARLTEPAEADEIPPAELPEPEETASATLAPAPVVKTVSRPTSAAVVPARALAPLDLEDTSTAPAKGAKTTKLVAKGGSCKEAEAEAGRARAATSDADRLFYYRRALRLCSQEPAYHVELGKVYSAIGRKEDAQFEYNKALEVDPENEAAQDELSLMMLDSTAAKNR